MISSFNRFHGHNSLKTVYSRGQLIRGPLISLKYTPNTRRKTYRLAVVVSKKVNKSAVVRNRIRRRIYEIARNHQLVDQPYDIVLSVFSDSVATMSSEQLTDMLKKQFQKAQLVKTPAQNS